MLACVAASWFVSDRKCPPAYMENFPYGVPIQELEKNSLIFLLITLFEVELIVSFLHWFACRNKIDSIPTVASVRLHLHF